MTKVYRTKEVAKLIGIHTNTVHKYEEWGFITRPHREENGYRIFTNLHIQQFKIARIALRNEIVAGGLRSMAIDVIYALALENYDLAIMLNKKYIDRIVRFEDDALQAIETVTQILKKDKFKDRCYTKKEVLDLLDITVDTLRNWERSGLVQTDKKENGYKIYSEHNLQILNVIKMLRLANYSLSAILRMLNAIEDRSNANIKDLLNASSDQDDVISACDHLLTSLNEAKKDAYLIEDMIIRMK